jgi:hypothetical protein
MRCDGAEPAEWWDRDMFAFELDLVASAPNEAKQSRLLDRFVALRLARMVLKRRCYSVRLICSTR